MIAKLTKEYICKGGKPILSEVDTDIFSIKYFHSCMNCDFCKDDCCKEGVICDKNDVKNILKNEYYIKEKIQIDAKSFFKEVFKDDDFPSGKATYIPKRGNACIFINKKGRGCLLHSILLSKHIDYHLLKPILCCLFPVSFDKGLLCPAPEFNKKEFACLKGDKSLYDGSRDEVKYYFGEGLVRELDKLRDSIIK